MAVTALSATQQQPAVPVNAAPGGELGASQFLQLLTAEMQNQDPMKPVDDTQSVAQLAQFTALSATQAMNQSFQNFQSNFAVLQSSTLIGKSVTVESADAQGNTSAIKGTVDTITVQNGLPYFSLKGADGNVVSDQNGAPVLYSTNQILAIGG